MRQQLTLFINQQDADEIEKIRTTYNPEQSDIIKAHVTICREDEIVNIDKVLSNLSKLKQKAITIKFGRALRSENGKGVLIPSTNENKEFYQLRAKILEGLGMDIKRPKPHITLMHPRNSTCTDEIFKEIEKANLPSKLTFETVSLIEQINDGKWKTVKVFPCPQNRRG